MLNLELVDQVVEVIHHAPGDYTSVKPSSKGNYQSFCDYQTQRILNKL